MTDNRYGDAPLGRSVEEVEQESGNLENSPVAGEQVRDDDMIAGVPAVPILSGPAGTAMIPTTPVGNRITEAEFGSPDDNQPRENRDSSEETA